jgi:hypothetical protein
VRLLALDPGQSFGWALSYTAEVSTTWDLAKYFNPIYPARIGIMHCVCGAWDLSDVSERGHRFSVLNQLIASRRRLEGIVYEEAPGLIGHASKWHLGYLATVETYAYSKSIPFFPVNASTWKKHSLGHGQAGKLESKTQALKQYGLDPTAPHDASDALHMLRYGVDTVELKAAG